MKRTPQLKEEINRATKLWGYDTSKTLNEQGIKSKINEEGLIGPRTKRQQDWLDDFDDHCSCPPPYAPCGCAGSIQPPGVTPGVWLQIQKAKNKRVVEQILTRRIRK